MDAFVLAPFHLSRFSCLTRSPLTVNRQELQNAGIVYLATRRFVLLSKINNFNYHTL